MVKVVSLNPSCDSNPTPTPSCLQVMNKAVSGGGPMVKVLEVVGLNPCVHWSMCVCAVCGSGCMCVLRVCVSQVCVCVCGNVLCLSWLGLPVCRVMQNGQYTFFVCAALGPLPLGCVSF